MNLSPQNPHPLIQNAVYISEISINEIAIDEGDEDWGGAEQSAYERLMDNNNDFIPGEDLLDWIKRLKVSEDV